MYLQTQKMQNFFPVPNEIFTLGLTDGEILVYTFLMRCEDRKNFKCHPSYATIFAIPSQPWVGAGKIRQNLVGNHRPRVGGDHAGYLQPYDDTMQMQVAVNIDRKIGGTDAQIPEVKQIPEQSTNTPVTATYKPAEPHPEPIPRKIRKSGTGCIYQINDHL